MQTSNDEYSRINKKAITCWIIGRFIFTIIFLPIFLGIMLFLLMKFFGHIPPVRYAINIISILVTVLVLLNNFLYPIIEYKEWKYGIFEDKVELMEGIFVKRKTVIPISRIQNINIEQGPIYRKYGLASVRIVTAGSAHDIPALTNEEAEKITENLKSIVEMGGRVE